MSARTGLLGGVVLIAGVVAAAIATRLAGADDAPAPAWERAPYEQGPVAGAITLDDRAFGWGVDGMLPVGLRLRPGAALDRYPALGIGMSISGSGAPVARDLGYTARLDRRTPRSGEWLGLSTGRGDNPGARLVVGTGIWQSFKPVQIEAGLMSSMLAISQQEVQHLGFSRDTRDTLRWVDSTAFRTVDRAVLQTNAQSTLRWQFGRVELAAVGGILLRGVGAPQRWGQAVVNVRATRQLVVLAAVGQRPAASLAFDPSTGPGTMLGVRLLPLAARVRGSGPELAPEVREWNTRTLPDGRTAMRVRCRDASLVELSGDFTDWAPVTLARRGGGWWEAEQRIETGLHQVQVRIDGGEWTAPPGLPTTQGVFAGTAGALVIE